jgi:hypothetical protein
VDRVSGYGETLLKNNLIAATKRVQRGKGRVSGSSTSTTGFPLSVATIPNPDGDGGFLKAELTIGRELYLWELRETIPGLLPKLLNRKWTILCPYPGMEWITSDDPFIPLHYNAPTDYTFTGGWAKSRGDLLLPLTPHHLLFAPLHNEDVRCYTVASRAKTFELQKLIVEHAHRWIFARQPLVRVAWFRNVRVDRDAYIVEHAEFKNWHSKQMRASIDRGRPSIREGNGE